MIIFLNVSCNPSVMLLPCLLARLHVLSVNSGHMVPNLFNSILKYFRILACNLDMTNLHVFHVLVKFDFIWRQVLIILWISIELLKDFILDGFLAWIVLGTEDLWWETAKWSTILLYDLKLFLRKHFCQFDPQILSGLDLGSLMIIVISRSSLLLVWKSICAVSLDRFQENALKK